MINFVTVWVGQRYCPEYVANLADMIRRNASLLESFSLWCITDRPDELPEGVQAIPAPAELPGWWAKIALFCPDRPWEPGERVVYFDLDVAITGRLEDFVQHKGIVKDWLWPCYNSSVMIWDHGEHGRIWSAFTPDVMHRSPGPIVPVEVLPHDAINGGDQEWISELAQAGDAWPLIRPDWVVNYRLHAQEWPPSDARVVSFNGKPKPLEVTEGWVPNVWKVGGYTSLPLMDGVNVDYSDIEANIIANLPRPVRWFTGFGAQSKAVALVCGAPSMRASLPDIRAQKRRGARIVTVNNAWRFLVENGIRPDVHVMLDARPENADFVKDAPQGVRYLIASQCHPDVFDALADRDVVMWHNGYGDNTFLRQALNPWWDPGPEQRPCILVPGGGTVGLRTLWLTAFSGYKTVHVYGMDSSYSDEGEHHAYPQALNDADRTLRVTLQGKTYRCAVWMARQADEFQTAWRELRRRDVHVIVHGQGLIPDLCRYLRQEAIAA
jgi:hypothetical protein